MGCHLLCPGRNPRGWRPWSLPTLPRRSWDVLHGRDPSLALLLLDGPLHLACMLGGLSCWLLLAGLSSPPPTDVPCLPDGLSSEGPCPSHSHCHSPGFPL